MSAPPSTSESIPTGADQVTEVLLRVEELTKEFPARRSLGRNATEALRAVDNVSFDVSRGEAFGIVGESGCGKSTLARLILRLLEPTSGRVTFEGQVITDLELRKLRSIRRRMQVVFQDPYASLDPRMIVNDIVEEPLIIHGIGSQSERRSRVLETLELVGLTEAQGRRKPHEFSGGQRQRIAIARALVSEPDLVVLDEPVASLDVSIQAQILNLLKDLQHRIGLTYIFIVHDLTIAEHFCDRIAVLYLGAIVELAESHTLFHDPQHPYSLALLSASPIPDPGLERKRRRIILPSEITGPIGTHLGCRFEPRCPVGHGREMCESAEPELVNSTGSHCVACHYAGERPLGTE